MSDDEQSSQSAERPAARGLGGTVWARVCGLFAPHPPDETILNRLPPDLHYLIGPALKYGRHQFEMDMLAFLDSASEDQLSELQAVAERHARQDDFEKVTAFLDQYPITEYDDAARLYFLFGVMDHAGFNFNPVREGDQHNGYSQNESAELPSDPETLGVDPKGAADPEETEENAEPRSDPPVNWDVVPAEFQYLQEAVDACGETRTVFFNKAQSRHIPFIESASQAQLDLVKSARQETARRGLRERIEEWCSPAQRPKPSVNLA
ncbi:MAG: hypothetical protein AAF907_16560, partial [Planctomycetota bacterium]